MESSQPVAPFFEYGLPPLRLPILTSHVDLHPIAPCSSTILAHEDLPKDLGKKTPSNAVQRPYSKPRMKVHVRPFEDNWSDLLDLTDLSNSLTSSSSSDCESSTNLDELKILKPNDEPGVICIVKQGVIHIVE